MPALNYFFARSTCSNWNITLLDHRKTSNTAWARRFHHLWRCSTVFWTQMLVYVSLVFLNDNLHTLYASTLPERTISCRKRRKHSKHQKRPYRWKLTLTPANIGRKFELSTRLHGSSSENWGFRVVVTRLPVIIRVTMVTWQHLSVDWGEGVTISITVQRRTSFTNVLCEFDSVLCALRGGGRGCRGRKLFSALIFRPR